MVNERIIGYASKIGVIIAAASAAAYGLSYIDLQLFVTLLGLGGFAGLAGLRQEIQSSGYKTTIIIAGGILISAGVATGYVKPENAVVLNALLGIGALPTLQHAVYKANKSPQPFKFSIK